MAQKKPLSLVKSRMQRASTLENSSFNVLLLKYLWCMTAVLWHSKSICFCSDHRRVNSLSTEDTSESFDCDRFLAK